MKHFIIFLVFFSTFALQAQIAENSPATPKQLNEQEFSSAKSLYLKMMESETYKLSRKTMKVFMAKLNGVPPPKQTDDILKYFESRLSETKFNSIEEAISIRDEWVNLRLKLFEDNKELYLLLSKASRSQIGEILQPEYDSVARHIDD